MRCFLSPFHSRRPRVEICEKSRLAQKTFFAVVYLLCENDHQTAAKLKKDRFDLHNFLHTFMDREAEAQCLQITLKSLKTTMRAKRATFVFFAYFSMTFDLFYAVKSLLSFKMDLFTS